MSQKTQKTVLAGVIGNVLEWYDFGLFAYFAPIIADEFFPHDNDMVQLLQTYGVFAIGFLMRPLGGLLFGHIGDTIGRKKALELSVLLMAIPTTCVGLLPNYAKVGLTAPMILTLIRILQGLSVGGEFIGSISFLGEHAPANQRGFLGSWTTVSATAGILAGSAVAALTHGLLSAEDLQSWGWRVPFLCGIAVGVVGLWLRMGIQESATFTRAETTGDIARLPIMDALRHDGKNIVTTAAIALIMSVGFYLPFVWIPTFLMEINQPALPSALTVNTLAMVGLLVLQPLGGTLSDRLGRKPLMLASAFGYTLLAYPLFLILGKGTFIADLAAQLVFALCNSLCAGPAPATMVELFPTRTRYSGIALGYNLTQAVFGGTAPFMATLLIHLTGDNRAPAFYLMAMGLIAALAVLRMKDRRGEEL